MPSKTVPRPRPAVKQPLPSRVAWEMIRVAREGPEFPDTTWSRIFLACTSRVDTQLERDTLLAQGHAHFWPDFTLGRACRLVDDLILRRMVA